MVCCVKPGLWETSSACQAQEIASETLSNVYLNFGGFKFIVQIKPMSRRQDLATLLQSSNLFSLDDDRHMCRAVAFLCSSSMDDKDLQDMMSMVISDWLLCLHPAKNM